MFPNYTDLSRTTIFLYFSSITCIVISVINIILEVLQFARRGIKYAKEFENYIQVILNVIALIFIFPVGHDNWVLPRWRWQVGAVAIFLGWFNTLILLKTMPFFGVNITMLFSVGFNFIFLLYLAILLILTFSFPFYMLLAFDTSYSFTVSNTILIIIV